MKKILLSAAVLSALLLGSCEAENEEVTTTSNFKMNNTKNRKSVAMSNFEIYDDLKKSFKYNQSQPYLTIANNFTSLVNQNLPDDSGNYQQLDLLTLNSILLDERKAIKDFTEYSDKFKSYLLNDVETLDTEILTPLELRVFTFVELLKEKYRTSAVTDNNGNGNGAANNGDSRTKYIKCIVAYSYGAQFNSTSSLVHLGAAELYFEF